MTKGTVSPFLEVEPTDVGRSGHPRSLRTYSSQLFQPHSAPAARASVLASVVPKLRRLDTSDDMLAHPKRPLLTLKLSSPSFLDSLVNDDFTSEPLYVIKTLGSSTNIERADPRGEGSGTTTTAVIKWPKTVPASSKSVSDGILIQLRGARLKGGETLLRRGTLPGSARKFNIPNYSHTLKWRRVGTSYWCTTSAVKGPVAIFEPAIASLPARLVVFETLHDRYDTRPMLVHHGVSLLLLDYLLVTSLLLVTDIQEWMSLKKHEGKDLVIPPVDADSGAVSIPQSAPSHVSTSASQWRKVMFGEPLYRKRSSSFSSIPSPSTDQANGLLSTPTSTNEITALVYDQFLPSCSSDNSSTSGAEDDYVYFSPGPTRPSSPSSESIFYPLTPSSAPSHTYLDPSFYGDSTVPPVPSIPDWCKSPGTSSAITASRRSSEHSTSSSKQLRVLPMPPSSSFISRPQSTPPRTTTSLRADKGLSISGAAARRLPEQPEPNNVLPRGAPRRLPRLPSTDQLSTHSRASSLGRSRSHSQSQPTKKWHPPYRQRTLPLPPISSSAGAIGLGPDFRLPAGKDAENDLAEWVHTLTSPTPREYPSLPLSRTVFDMPPPAYNSIEFHERVELSDSSSPRLPSDVHV